MCNGLKGNVRKFQDDIEINEDPRFMPSYRLARRTSDIEGNTLNLDLDEITWNLIVGWFALPEKQQKLIYNTVKEFNQR